MRNVDYSTTRSAESRRAVRRGVHGAVEGDEPFMAEAGPASPAELDGDDGGAFGGDEALE